MNQEKTKDDKGWEILNQLGNMPLTAHWLSLSASEKAKLTSQLASIDFNTLSLQKKLLALPAPPLRKITPFTEYHHAGNSADALAGKDAIAKGLAGCLIVAGGQGTRLGFDGPKGMYPVTLIKRKSLFELLAEKVAAAEEQAGCHLPLAIMTSEENDLATRKFFADHHNFGLSKDHLHFFIQKNLPFLDTNGVPFFESKTRLAEGPDGNGGALQAFFGSGIFDSWYAKGVRFLNFILVDNALADPFDAELIGFQIRTGCEVAVKCTEKSSPEEKVGILAKENGRTTVVEYSELNSEEAGRRDEKGRLVFRLANLSLFSFTMDFISRVCGEKYSMPLHKAFKAAKFLDENGQTVKSEKPIAWKFERFIFDLLNASDKVNALIYPRESCFAPLKNSTGPDSPSTVSAALEASDRRTLNAITRTSCELSPIEISQKFYYPTQDLIDRWEGRIITEPGYIDA